MTPETECCASCRFYLGNYVASKVEPVGFCRRFPPVETDTLKAGIAAYTFPMVTAGQWCGEYDPLDQDTDPDLAWMPKHRQ
jgi:hypothetical protein